MVPMLGAALIISPFSLNLAWRIIRRWKKSALAIFGIQVRLEFEEDPSQLDRGGIIVGLAQQSLLDPTAAYSIWDRRLLSIWNIEYALIPFFGWISFILGWVIIRQNKKQATRQLNKAAEYARNGGLVFLSAEGKRSADGRLNPYKKGPFVLAIQTQSTIHPMHVRGSRYDI
jgi:1-acyl-sn-glycerol-3-phosphate acyltransferase